MGDCTLGDGEGPMGPEAGLPERGDAPAPVVSRCRPPPMTDAWLLWVIVLSVNSMRFDSMGMDIRVHPYRPLAWTCCYFTHHLGTV